MPRPRSIYNRPGERNLNSKVDAQQAAMIRYLSQFKAWTVKRLCEEFGLSHGAISNIAQGKSWTKLDADLEIATLLHRANLIQSVRVGRDEAPAEANAQHLTLVKSDRMTSRRDQVVTECTASRQKTDHMTSRASQALTEYQLVDVMAEIGLERIEDLTDEALTPLRGQIAKQQVLIDAYHLACPEV